ncbi:methyltransferase domain-containing protein [Streptomyces sp. NBC_00237]|uniref:class I SAM-dependent methyltransferase n=1 Tax=Streptomyces sp. NBC_00237 TaxID=2975687 RepID=UPI00225BCBDE|nr:methyltransferase domain-containing protein [Streptomyces sp. NBC_00237]MCX5201114.1 methyltransferase domain-containing protein [Streptomyces sp. NBC_00237]
MLIMLNAKTLAKAVIGAVNRPLAKLRFARSAGAAAPLKIEVGAHTSRRPGWIGTDVCWRTRHYLDATRTWPVHPASVSHVYADNVIEHIRLEPNRRLFREARRALAPGGRIRLATPDVEHAVRLYTARDETTVRQMARDRQAGYEMHHPVDLLRSMFQDCGHHEGYLWDFDTLTAELEAAGFTAVRRCAAGESDDPALRGLESRPGLALIVEAEAAV